MTDARQFDAFFSYASRADAALVRRVERYLEAFHRHPLYGGSKLDPLRICVDGSDLRIRSTGRLMTVEEALVAHLSQARWLVVFCSQHAKHSRFVANEIEWWLTHRSVESIIPVVTEGPTGQVGRDVFPNLLAEHGLHEALWIDLRGEHRRWFGKRGRAQGERPAAEERLRLAALLHNYKGIPEPWQRARRLGYMVAVAASVIVVCCALAAYGWTRTDAYAMLRLLDTPLNETELKSQEIAAERIGQLARAGRLDSALTVSQQLPPESRSDLLCSAVTSLEAASPGAAEALIRHAFADSAARKAPPPRCSAFAFPLGQGELAIQALTSADVDAYTGDGIGRSALDSFDDRFVNHSTVAERAAVLALVRERLPLTNQVALVKSWAVVADPRITVDFLDALEQILAIVPKPGCPVDPLLPEAFNREHEVRAAIELLVQHDRRDAPLRLGSRLCEPIAQTPPPHAQPLPKEQSSSTLWLTWAKAVGGGLAPDSTVGFCAAVEAGINKLSRDSLRRLLAAGTPDLCQKIGFLGLSGVRDEVAREHLIGNARLVIGSRVLTQAAADDIYWKLFYSMSLRLTDLPRLRAMALENGRNSRVPAYFNDGEQPNPLLVAMVNGPTSTPLPPPTLDSLRMGSHHTNGACVLVLHGFGRSFAGDPGAERHGLDTAIALLDAYAARRDATSPSLEWSVGTTAADCIVAGLAALDLPDKALAFAAPRSHELHMRIAVIALTQATAGNYASAQRIAQLLPDRRHMLHVESQILERWLQR